MRVPREVWWIAGLTGFVLLLVALLQGQPAETEERGILNRTTYSSASYGLRGLYLALRELGYDARRLRGPLTAQGLPERGILFVVEPGPLTTTEWSDLQSWVAKGNTLLLSGRSVLPETERVDVQAPSWFEPAAITYAAAAQPTYLSGGVERLAVQSEFRITVGAPGGDEQEDRSSAKGTDEEEEERGWPPASGPGSSEIEESLRRAAPVLSDDKGAVVAYAQVGEGRVLLLASPWSLSNEGIDEADNFRLVLNALGPPGDAPVCFDEYHHGYGANLAWQMLPLPVKLGLGQVMLGLVLVMFARSRRLGPVVPLERGGRQRSEFLGTMAAVLQRGRATRLALRTAYETAAQRLSTEFGVPPEADEETVAQAAGRAGPEAGERLAQVVAEIRAALSEEAAPTEARAAALVRRLDDALAEARRI